MTRIGQTMLWLLAAVAFAALPARAQEHAAPSKASEITPGHVEAAAGETAHPTGDHGAAAGHGEPAHGEAHGEPPLINEPAAGIVPALTTLIIFVLLLVVLGKYAWGPIASGLQAREEKIRKDIADAEAARARAEQTLAEYNKRLATAEGEVRDIIGRATADAERVATGIRARAEQEAEERLERARREIDAAQKQAIAQVHAETATLATAVAEKILRRNLNADDQRDLVNQSLEQLQTIK